VFCVMHFTVFLYDFLQSFIKLCAVFVCVYYYANDMHICETHDACVSFISQVLWRELIAKLKRH